MSASCWLRVLTYHRIANREEIDPYDPAIVSATPTEFARQMTWLAKHYNVIDVSEILEGLDERRPLPKRALAITFDDAYPDFKTSAWPVMKALGLPVTLFVPTSFPSRPQTAFWWDRLYAAVTNSSKKEIRNDALGRLSLATADDKQASVRVMQNYVKALPHKLAMLWLNDLCRELDAEGIELSSTMPWGDIKSLFEEGVTIGAHSRSHPLLTQISDEDIYDEIAGSQEDLSAHLGRVLPIFCYPAGAFNGSVEAIAARAGIRLGFGTRAGHNRLGRCDLLALRRINVSPRTSLRILRIRLSLVGGYADRLRKEAFR